MNNELQYSNTKVFWKITRNWKQRKTIPSSAVASRVIMKMSSDAFKRFSETREVPPQPRIKKGDKGGSY